MEQATAEKSGSVTPELALHEADNTHGEGNRCLGFALLPLNVAERARDMMIFEHGNHWDVDKTKQPSRSAIMKVAGKSPETGTRTIWCSYRQGFAGMAMLHDNSMLGL